MTTAKGTDHIGPDLSHSGLSMGAPFPRNVLAVCVSWKPESWSIPEVPFHCQVSNGRPYPRVKTRERIAHLANRRNEALKVALSSYPNTQHVLMVDSYYLAQTTEIRKLFIEYAHLYVSEECIVGASTWFQDRTRIIPRIRFWDSWITPEAAHLHLPTRGTEESWMRVKAVGACYIFPRKAWEAHPYSVSTHGGEHTSLCVESGLLVWLSLSTQLWREPVVYPWAKRVRQTLHLGRIRNWPLGERQDDARSTLEPEIPMAGRQ
jgi:hypothetical protein